MISKEVVDSLNKLGIALAAKPDFPIPELPRDISELDDEALMDLFVQFTGWSDYLSGARAIAVINEREADRLVTNKESDEFLNQWKGGSADRIALVKAKVAADPEVAELKYDLDTKYAFRKLLETRADDVERNSQVVSRELTRRTSGLSGIRSRKDAFRV
jgi:hypothetical protein